MSDENDRDLSDLFRAPPPQDTSSPQGVSPPQGSSPMDDERFVDRVNARLRTRRRVFFALRAILLLAVVVTVAPFVPPFIDSLLKILGL